MEKKKNIFIDIGGTVWGTIGTSSCHWLRLVVNKPGRTPETAWAQQRRQELRNGYIYGE